MANDLKNGKLKILCYTDADFAGDKRTGRSTTGLILMVGDNAVIWSPKLQPVVANSTAEAEFYDMGDGVNESIAAIHVLLKEIRIAVTPQPVVS